MAEVHQKRLRDDSNDSEIPEFTESNSTPNSKRQKPYNNLLSLLDEEEQEELFLSLPSQDLSAIVTTLQQEISSPSAAFDFEPPPFSAEDHHQTTATSAADGGVEDDGVKSVIRHLLEASDDELGIPNTDCNSVEVKSDDFPFAFVDNGLWELEDVAANYYTVLQSELFM